MQSKKRKEHQGHERDEKNEGDEEEENDVTFITHVSSLGLKLRTVNLAMRLAMRFRDYWIGAQDKGFANSGLDRFPVSDSIVTAFGKSSNWFLLLSINHSSKLWHHGNKL